VARKKKWGRVQKKWVSAQKNESERLEGTVCIKESRDCTKNRRTRRHLSLLCLSPSLSSYQIARLYAKLLYAGRRTVGQELTNHKVVPNV
jgi:hypothetical protein